MESNLKTDRRLCAWGIDLGMCTAVSHCQRIRQTRALKIKTKDCPICETGKRPNQSAPPIFASKNYKIVTTPTKAALKFWLTHGKQWHSNSIPKHSNSTVEAKIEREKPMLKTILKHNDKVKLQSLQNQPNPQLQLLKFEVQGRHKYRQFYLTPRMCSLQKTPK
jgi:hypothetical protein